IYFPSPCTAPCSALLTFSICSDPSLLVSPLLVAGVVIGLVLVLSCVTIIVGSLRKDGRLRNYHSNIQHLGQQKASDGFSYGGSFGELRSTCMEEFPPAFEFASYLETLSRVNVLYPDSPPCYDECVGPGATQIYIPTDDPPPYSLTDPCHRGAAARDPGTAEEAAPGAPAEAAGLQHWRQPRPLSPLSLEAAPLYEALLCEQNVPLPQAPVDALKTSSTDCETLLSRIL
uniref:BEAN1 protein n=1 Tax=Nothoprocta perdicaria TaxID=30464 RepID=A0A8C6YUJ0_NOTPE